MEVAPSFYDAIIGECSRSGLHPVIIHSHPQSHIAVYSPSDDYGETRLLRVLGDLLPGHTVGSLVVGENGSVTGRELTDAGFRPFESITILGRRIRVIQPNGLSADTLGQERFDRQILAFGPEGQSTLSRLRVGVVGLGGTGSIVAELLARQGIGELVLVDADNVDETNLSRLMCASDGDVGRSKVEVAAFSLRRAGHVHVTPLTDSVLKQAVLSAISHCDLVFSCVDNDSARAVLNRFSHQYYIPMVDMGVRLDARSGNVTACGARVSIVGVAATCLRCSHHLDPERIRAESMSLQERSRLAKEGYVMGVAGPAPAVIAVNTLVAGLAVTSGINLFVNLTGSDSPTSQIFDGANGEVFTVTPSHNDGCGICDPTSGVQGMGDACIVSAY
ncbi:MAG: ThiF family adenylyltransferase [Gemmatimonadales bacterium]